MIDTTLVKSKLADLQTYYEEITKILESEVSEIIHDTLKLHSVERLFQLIVDTAIDINTHIITQTGAQVPDDYQSTFVTLSEKGVLPQEFARRIAPSVGLRNLVVHRYGKVDVERMIRDVQKEIAQYHEYARHIVTYLEQVG